VILTTPNDNQNGNGSGEYRPAVEYEYLDADVWADRTENKVAYTEDILKELDISASTETDEENTQN
jgi:hypothetical protein